MDTVVFTPAALVDLLTQISELEEYDISAVESENGDVHIKIGSSDYTISSNSAEEVEAPEDVIDEIDDINDATFDSLPDDSDVVESGILKELAKSLLVGGMIRLTKKLL